MKRILLAALVVLMLFAAEALAEETLPTDIAAYFSESIVLDFATLSDYDEASHCFVLVKAKNQDNVLHSGWPMEPHFPDGQRCAPGQQYRGDCLA